MDNHYYLIHSLKFFNFLLYKNLYMVNTTNVDTKPVYTGPIPHLFIKRFGAFLFYKNSR